MSKKSKKNSEFLRFDSTRRGFLRGSVALGTAVAGSRFLTGCDDADDDTSSVSFDEEADVIIVGAGGAGMTAAIEAMRGGASVILLEKAADSGGTTGVSGGVMQGSETSVQEELEITDSTEDHFDFYDQAGEGIPDPELLQLLTDNSSDAVDFMQDLGLEYTNAYAVSSIPTVDADLFAPRIHEQAEGGGGNHVDVLRAEVDNLGGDIRFETPVTDLIKDADEGVVGVTATVDGESVNFGARKAVILASGGMDWNANLARAYSPQQLWELETGVCLCAAENTGDGMIMGMGVGADLAGLGGTIGYPSLRIGRNFPGIWVNRYGQRFVNEAGHYAYVMRAVFQQEDHMAWGVFDADVAALGGAQIGGWSEDLSEEIADGTIKTGETLEDLADELGVDATSLQATVDRWNNDMAAPEDTLYGRTDQLEPLETGPWYAARATSTNLGSCGGLRIDTNARVMSLWDEPIPRLYAAGMVAGGYIGPYYPGSGTAILGTVVLGRIAGQNAAALEAKRTRTEA